MYFEKSRLRKIWLDKCLKSRVLEDHYTDNVENGLKHCCNQNGAPFQYLLNTCKEGTLEKVFFSNTQNPKTVC